MTVQELKQICEQAIELGLSDAPIIIDGNSGCQLVEKVKISAHYVQFDKIILNDIVFDERTLVYKKTNAPKTCIIVF